MAVRSACGGTGAATAAQRGTQTRSRSTTQRGMSSSFGLSDRDLPRHRSDWEAAHLAELFRVGDAPVLQVPVGVHQLVVRDVGEGAPAKWSRTGLAKCFGLLR